MSSERNRQVQQDLGRTVERGADAGAECRRGEQPSRFDHAALARRPLGLDVVSPCSKLTAAANSTVHTLVGLLKLAGALVQQRPALFAPGAVKGP